jgi:NAD(P) transhydrogenase
LVRNRVQVVEGVGRFAGPHEILVEGPDAEQRFGAQVVVLAVGSVPGVPPDITVDHETVLTSDDVLTLSDIPRTLAVIGAGIIGTEYATIFAALGVEVTMVDMRPVFLDMIDREIVDVLTVHAREMGVTIRLGEEVAGIERNGGGVPVVVLKSGKRFVADRVLVSAGRRGATDGLDLEKAGLEADARGKIRVNEHGQTAVPHIYAAGDVIGFPALASTSMEQGRLASCHAFGVPASTQRQLYPFGMYAIPEVAWVGATEGELTAKGVPFETGVARYKEIARGQILGDPNGMLKLIFRLGTKEILGVWGIGSQATELVHIGQAVMALGGTLDYFVSAVFNYPTLAECYKVAALDGYNKIYALGDAEPARAAANTELIP